jgi:hypothetical protein
MHVPVLASGGLHEGAAVLILAAGDGVPCVVLQVEIGPRECSKPLI